MTLDIYIPGVPQNANAKGHWASGKWKAVSERAKFRRLSAEIAATESDLHGWVPPTFTRITARHLSPVRRRRDPLGLAERLKGIIDGLVDAGVIPDDDETHIEIVLAPSAKAKEAGIHLRLEKVA